MALTVEALLAPVSPDNPVGDDLSYANDRAEIEQAFDTSQSSNDAPADQDWRGVLKLIESQFAQTKDLWLAVYLCRAGARSGSLLTVETGAQVLAALTEQYWATVHPRLEEVGVPGRKSACDSLTTRGGFLGPLEKTVLIAHPRLGAYSGADLNRFRAETEAADGYGRFRAALDELGDESLVQALAQLESIEDGLRRTEKVFTTQADGEATPNLSVVYAVLTGLKQAIRHFLPRPAILQEEPEPVNTQHEAAVGAGRGRAEPAFVGAVASRGDVVRALEAVAEYYRKTEPSHPVQFLIQRAQRWVELDFMSLLREIAPGGVVQAEGLLTSPKPSET